MIEEHLAWLKRDGRPPSIAAFYHANRNAPIVQFLLKHHSRKRGGPRR